MKSRMLSHWILLLALFGTAICQDSPKGPSPLKPEIADGQLISRVEPMYPQRAKIAHIEGDVVLKAIISKHGNIENLKVVSGQPILAEAAMNAVKQWKYKPWLLNGEPVEVETTVTVSYHMLPTQAQAEQELNKPLVPPPNPEGTSSVPKKLRISSGVAASNRISGEEPVYPLEAKRQHIQGDVVLRALADEKGNVVSLQVMSGDPILAESALAAVKTWKYKPWLLNGEPVQTEFPVTIKFHM